MYNYFMLMGVVEGYILTTNCIIIELKVERTFGEGADHFKIKVFGALADIIKENVNLNQKLTIKGRMVQTDKLELVAERIFF